MKQRLQKYLASQNLASRRVAETYIQAGYVWVNGECVTQLGTQVDPDFDQIELKLPKPIITTTIAFNKPRGIMSNCVQPGEKEILDLLPRAYQNLHTIGRLDKDSEGLILLTDDGVLAKHILATEHPHTREYLVWVNDPLTEEMQEQLESGILLFGTATKKLQIKCYTDTYFKMTLKEGKNRQIRRMLLQVGLIVLRLKRISFGPISLEALPKGEFRCLSQEECEALAERP